MAASVLHPQDLCPALIELVVANRVKLETQPVHGLNGAFIVEESGDQRTGANEVPGRNHDIIWVARFLSRHITRQVVDPTGLLVHDRGTGPSRLNAKSPRRLQAAVEIIEC